MSEVLLGFEARVPGNASRFFTTREEALAQPDGAVRLAWRPDDPYLYNSAFDASLIRHDGSYCTSVVDLDQVVQLPTASYFFDRALKHLRPSARVVDIGCGQGEFVERLRRSGLQAEGYDPVLRTEASHLHRRYWTVEEPPADLYVMRCVLPHIAEPWEFLETLARSSPGCLVLIEFQRAEWILEHSVWYQLSHDHVNLFRFEDFDARHHVVDRGTFADGEWAWALVAPGREPRVAPAPAADVESGFRRLSSIRRRALEALVHAGRPLAVWGAAGKGIVLAHALAQEHEGITAVDADPARWGLYLEGSGVRVDSPDTALRDLPPETLVLVCNPNHSADVRRRVRGRLTVALPADFAAGDTA